SAGRRSGGQVPLRATRQRRSQRAHPRCRRSSARLKQQGYPARRYPLRAMANVGPGEILLLLLLALLLFGAKRLPEIGRSVGRGMREFKDAVSGIEEDERGVEPITVGRREDGQPAASAQDRQRFCSGCGAKTRPDDGFWQKCGAALERPPAALAG